MNIEDKYIDIVLPLPIEQMFTYLVPAKMSSSVSIGSRVIVPFGTRKIYTGVVFHIYDENPQKKYKMILAWEEEHEPYDLDEGSPIRLVNGQTEPGDVNKPRWVSRIEKIVVE